MTEKERFKLIPAVYLILRRNDEVVLLRRANTGYQDGKYGLPAGHLEGDESATTGIVREAKEETGVEVNPQHLRLAHVCHRLSRNQPGQERLDLFFETEQWLGDPKNTESDKCDDLSWFPLYDLPENTIPLIKNVLHDIASNVYYSEYTEEPL